MRQAGFAVLLFLLAVGCGRPTPKAPALRDEPVYTNSVMA